MALAAVLLSTSLLPAFAVPRWVPLPVQKSEALSGRPLPGDPARGRIVFAKCSGCHEAGEARAHKVGPDLSGVLGRPAAAHADFAYSDALAQARRDGLVWTRDLLDSYLKAPSRFLPDNAMAFIGLESEREREDLIAYLASLPPRKDSAWLISNTIVQAAIPLPEQSPLNR